MNAFAPDSITLDTVLSYAALGLIVGFGYYASMRLNPSAEGERTHPRWVGAAVHLLRLAAAITFFAWVASLGMVPILSAFGGFLCGRVVALRATGLDA